VCALHCGAMAQAHQNRGDDNVERDGYEIALERIAAEREARTGRLDLSKLGLSRLPKELLQLMWLVSIDCSENALNELDLLASFSGLQRIYADVNPVDSIGFVITLPDLTELSLSLTEIRSVQGIERCSSLRKLFLAATQIEQIDALAALKHLQILHIWDTGVTDLSALRGLSRLQSLDCSFSSVADIDACRNLSSLTALRCHRTLVADLEPLSLLGRIAYLDCSWTQVETLLPLESCSNLQDLIACDIPLVEIPEAILALPKLRILTASSPRGLGEIPAEVLSQHYGENCLPRLRAHLADVAAGAEPLRDVKVIVLGNGRIGKTQLCRRLRGLPFEDNANSTHGIGVSTAELPMPDGPPALLNLWDFGGQDLYHGTHALFMQTRAIFVVLWTPGSEPSATAASGGARARRTRRPCTRWRRTGAAFSRWATAPRTRPAATRCSRRCGSP